MPLTSAVEIEALWLEGLAARECQQPVRELRGTAGALQRMLERLLQLGDEVTGLLRDAALDGVEIAEDDRQQVVEVVRDAAGELADGFELLRLAQGLLGLASQLRLGLQPPDVVQHRAQRQQSEDHRGEKAEADQREHPAAQHTRGDLAPRQQFRFMDKDRVEIGPDRVHQVPAHARLDDRNGLFFPALAHKLHIVPELSHQRFDFRDQDAQPLQLRGVVGGECPDLVDAGGDRSLGAIKRLEELGVFAQHEAALARFGVQQLDQQDASAPAHIHCVHDPALRLGGAVGHVPVRRAQQLSAERS